MRTAGETYDAMVKALKKSQDQDYANKRIGVYTRALVKCGRNAARERLLDWVDKIDQIVDAPCP